MRKKPILPIYACLFGLFGMAPLPCYAATLGDLNVASFLGQTLSGTVDISQTDGQDLPITCFQAVKPENAARQELPWLADVQLRRQKRAGQTRLRLSTQQPIDEPLLAIAVQIGCGVDVTREYILMLSPATLAQPGAALAEGSQLSNSPDANAAALAPADTPASSKPKRRPAVAKSTNPAPAPNRPAAPAAHPTHTWLIGEGESVASLSSALYPDNPKMRKAFTQAVFQANPDLVMEYSSRDLLPKGMALVVPDLQRLANTSAALPESQAAPAAKAATISPNNPTSPASANPLASAGSAQPAQTDRLVVSELNAATGYPGDLVVNEQIAASRQELLQLNRFIGNALPPSNAAETSELLALQRRLVAMQETLTQLHLTEKNLQAPGQLPPAGTLPADPGSPAVRPVPDADNQPPAERSITVPGKQNPAVSSRSQQLILGAGMSLLGIVLGIVFAYLGQLALARWRERSQYLPLEDELDRAIKASRSAPAKDDSSF